MGLGLGLGSVHLSLAQAGALRANTALEAGALVWASVES